MTGAAKGKRTMYGLQRNAPTLRGRDDGRMAQLDITYITERIIAALFPVVGDDPAYKSSVYEMVQMLRNKHGDNNYMIINLSERRSDIHQLHKQVLDFGWPDALSPPLERLCNICKTIDSWLNSSPKNVVLVHCKGGLGRMAVVVAAYIDYSNICASDDQDLGQFALKHFYDEKLARLIQPSQRRYVHYFAGLLSGAIKINNSSLFLHKIIIRGIPNFDSQVGCRPFIKIYQGMQPVYVSNVFTPAAGVSYICITLDPCLQLRSDVLVKCFNKSVGSTASRDVIFRCQFHTCAVSNNLLKFDKSELDEACDDHRFPDRGAVEFVFTSAPDRISKPHLASDIGSSLDRWNSYENFATDIEERPSYTTQARDTLKSSSLHHPKYKLDSETIQNGTSVIANTSYHSSTLNQGRTLTDYEVNKYPDKTGNEQEQLDEILRELLGDHTVPCSTVTPANQRGISLPSNTPLLHGTITTESDSMRTTLSWQASQAGPSKSALVMRQTVAQPSPHSRVESDSMRYREMTSHRQPPDVDLDKWGATERYFYDAPSYKESKHFDTRSEAMTREEIITNTTNQKFLAPGDHPSLMRSPSPSAGFRTEPQARSFRSNSPYNPPAPQQREPLHRTVSDHRRYASDSEDHVSWLEEQRSRLPSSRSSGRRTWRQQLAAENSELKSAQNAYYRSKRAVQSDTEDGATYDHRRRLGPSISLDEPTDTFSRSYAYEHGPKSHESYQYNYDTRSSSHYPASQNAPLHGSGYRPPTFRASAPTSPVIPERGDSSREAVLRSQTNAHEWLKTSEAYGARYDEMNSPRAYESDVEMQRLMPHGGRQTPSHERTTSPFPRHTPIPKLGEVEEEVISLQPIGRGIQNLEPGASAELINKSPPSAYPASTNQYTLTGGVSTLNRNTDSFLHQQQPVHGGSYNTLNQSSVNYNTLNQSQIGNSQTLPFGIVPIQQNGSQTLIRQQQQNVQTTSVQRGIVQSNGHANQYVQQFQQQPIQQQSFFERQEMSSVGGQPLPSNGAQRNFAQESYIQTMQQQGRSSVPPGGLCNSASIVRGQPYFEMHGEQVQSQQPTGGKFGGTLRADEQNQFRSGGGYSYETTQQRHFVQSNQQSGFAGGVPVESRSALEIQRVPSVGSSVQVGRTQPDSMRRLNSSMQNLLNTENAGNGASASNFYTVRTRAASVSSLGGGGGGDEGRGGPNPTLISVRDTSGLWHKENMTREDATAYLLDKPPGWFIVRNSSTYPGAYGLAVKVSQVPPNVVVKRNSQTELVRHFLIETTPAGVQLKGNPIEPVFATLAALIYQHTLTPMALPLKLVLPASSEPARFDTVDLHASDSLTHLAGTYAAFNVLYINSVDLESLTGPEAMSRAIDSTFSLSSRPPDAVEVNLKVSTLGITLTDNRRRLFFRRHYPINSLTFCGFDTKDRRWNFTSESGTTISQSRVFGFIARKQGSAVENSCHLFAELDPTHPSATIVGTITSVMSGQGTLSRN